MSAPAAREDPPFETVLVANRGEIALRIARTCREMGIRVIVAHSAADRDSAAVRFADQAVQVGPSPSRDSYLNMPAIIEAALHTGAQAIHPGYGFLSEDPDFAEACQAYGLTFVGPSPAVMAELGDKATARARMAAAGVPVLPGSHRTVESPAEAMRVAGEVGYPLIVKAAAGGGGRGMVVARDRRDLTRAYREARAYARAVFGDDRVYLERFLESARHVEVQVLCDRHGNAVHLGERDCSVQRRHQKLIEETPAPGLPPGLAEQMGQASLAGVRAAGYEGAGTLEFLVDSEGRFYFIEINCRIQVEHPVTEAVTGLDLVREQLRIAAGRPLGFSQEGVRRRGHAIEARVNAEDPARGFLPTPGVVSELALPGGPFTRVDTHAFPGYRIPPDYDSLLAKVVAWAPDREQALARLERALGEVRVRGGGVRTTVGFLLEVLAHPAFRDAKHTTGLVDQMLAQPAP